MKIGFFMINRLRFSNFNVNSFNEKYKVFRVTALLDYSSPDDGNEHIVYSVAYETSAIFYCLVPAGITTEALRDIYRDYKFNLEEVSVESVHDYILINLFINKYPNKKLSFNNYTSLLFFVYDEERNDVIPTLRFEVDSNCILSSTKKHAICRKN